MKKMVFLVAAANLLIARQAVAQENVGSWREFAGVTNTSFVEPSGDRAIQLSIDVAGAQQAVFDAFATTDGFTSWAVPLARVDMRVGGIVETNYNADAKFGSPDNIKNVVVAYIPGRLIVLRNVQAPRTFVHPELFQRTVTIIEFAAIDAGNTRVTITNSGYGSSPDFDRIYKMFEWGDAYTLAGVKRRFDQGPIDWATGEPNLSATAADNRFKGEN